MIAKATIAVPIADGEDANGNPLYSGASHRVEAGEKVTKTSLRELGMTDAEIDGFIADGTIGEPDNEGGDDA